jgi:hypothetical protein
VQVFYRLDEVGLPQDEIDRFWFLDLDRDQVHGMLSYSLFAVEDFTCSDSITGNATERCIIAKAVQRSRCRD